MTYQVLYTVRQRGAIGSPWVKTITVSASSEDEAKEKAFNQLQEQGYETFQPTLVRRVHDK